MATAWSSAADDPEVLQFYERSARRTYELQRQKGCTPMSTFATRPSFSTPEQQPVLSFLGSPERLVLGGHQTCGEFALLESTGNRGHTAPTHRHLHASETFIVLDGDLLIQVGDEQRVAGAGDTALLPRGLPHTFVVLSPTARYMTLHTPAGFEEFVRGVSDLAADGGAPDRAVLVATAAEHGIELLGPGLPLPEVG
jgi:quercetin dioxygenase-like cupin family protein